MIDKKYFIEFKFDDKWVRTEELTGESEARQLEGKFHSLGIKARIILVKQELFV